MHLGICLCPSPQGRPAMPGDETEGEHTKGGCPPTGRCVPPPGALHILYTYCRAPTRPPYYYTIENERHCTYCTHILPRTYSPTTLLKDILH